MNPLALDTITQIADSKIIVALDFDNEKNVMNLVAKLDPTLCKLKIGKELFTVCGPKLVEKLVISGYKIFLDLKFHDIPNTVYKACKAASNLGIWMLNVHASGGLNMLTMAKQGVSDAMFQPLLTAVTTLTSFTQADLIQVGVETNINDHVINLAKLANKANLDGVVCSAHEAPYIKQQIGHNFLTISPGIRLTKDITDDQKRIMTPVEAIQNQVDYIVIGRPISQAPDPMSQLQRIINMLRTCS